MSAMQTKSYFGQSNDKLFYLDWDLLLIIGVFPMYTQQIKYMKK